MEPHRNIEGNAAISAHEIGLGYITVDFSDGSRYRYAYASAGREKVEGMKGLATDFQGLDNFINSTVGKLYDRKEK